METSSERHYEEPRVTKQSIAPGLPRSLQSLAVTLAD